MKHEEIKLLDRVVYARGAKGPLIGKRGKIDSLVHDGLCMVEFDQFGRSPCMPENLDPVYEVALPRHIAMTIEHNPHAVFYQKAGEYLGNMSCLPEFADDEDRRRCVESNDIWIATWYPRTPVGSYQVAASTLERLFELMKEG